MRDASDVADQHAAPVDLIELGRIVAAHGVRGQVKILPHDANSATLQGHKTWWLQQAAAPLSAQTTPRPVRVLSCKRAAEVLIAHIEGVDDRDEAQGLKGATLHLPRSAFPQAAHDEYYWVDLIGCDVYGQGANAQDVRLGQVVHVSDNGAHALLKVARLTKQSDAAQPVPVHDAKGRTVEALIPFVAAHVCSVDLTARRIDTNWPADF